MLPDVLITPVPANTLPPVILAVVVMLDVEFNALTTFALKLNPAAFKLPEVTLPDTDTNVPVKLGALTMVVATTLLPVTLPETLTAAPSKLDPVMLPVAVIWAAVCMLPVAVTSPPVRKLPA